MTLISHIRQAHSKGMSRAWNTCADWRKGNDSMLYLTSELALGRLPHNAINKRFICAA